MSRFQRTANGLIFKLNYETLQIESWGPHSLRVRATMSSELRDDWISALLPQVTSEALIDIGDNGATITNGNLSAEISEDGKIRFINTATAQEILAEKPIHMLSVPARHYQSIKSDLFSTQVNFAAYDGEHIYEIGRA